MNNKSERYIAAEILNDITTENAYSNLALKSYFMKYNLSSEQKNFITGIVYGTIDRILTIDWIIEQFNKSKRIHHIIRSILRLGIYEIYFRQNPGYAVCNEYVNIAKEFGKVKVSGFVNGILRNVIRNKDNIEYPDKSMYPEKYLSVFYSFPEWLVHYWVESYGIKNAEEIVSYSVKDHSTAVRPNLLKIDACKWEEYIKAKYDKYKIGKWNKNAYYIEGIGNIAEDKMFINGDYTVQSESSMIAARILDPKPESNVLDICSAPGGKSAYIAELMINRGKIVSCDIYEHRLDLIRKNVERLGIDIIDIKLNDGTVYNKEFENKFDSVLADVPCSGLGVINGKPDIKYSKSLEQVYELSKIQYKILDNCSRYVKAGGSIVYSTCTISELENINNIKKFLEKHKDFEPCDISVYLPDDFDEKRIRMGSVQLFPNIDNIDGFYIAKLRRLK